MSENGEMSLGEITEALSGMENGDTLAFASGAVAYRENDVWEITLPPSQEDPEFSDLLSSAADEYEPGGPRARPATAEESFRRLLGGE